MDDLLQHGLLDEPTATPLPPELVQQVEVLMRECLPRVADPAEVLRQFRRFVTASRSPTALLALFERDRSALETLLRLLGSGPWVSDQLVADPESFDLVRAGGGAPVPCSVLVEEIVAGLDTLSAGGRDFADQDMRRLLRGVIDRERLRIAFAEFIAGASTEAVAAELTVVAEAVIEAAVRWSWQRLVACYGVPRTPERQPGRFGVIGLGALGARQMGYGSPLEMMFLADLCNPTDGGENIPGEQFFDLLARQVLLLLGADQADPLLPVVLSRRPQGQAGPLVMTVTEAHRHYLVAGRTWERLLHVQSRPCAGDLGLSSWFLECIGPWVYRRYLQPPDFEGLHTQMRKLARRISRAEAAVSDPGDAASGELALIDVRGAVGGLADIERMVALLQVINGADKPSLRVPGTVAAIQALLVEDCLTDQEAALLSDHHQLLTRYEHCRQLRMPPATIAFNLGYRQADGRGDAVSLREAVEAACRVVGRGIASLLDDAGQGALELPPETELLLDPQPEDEFVADVLGRHGFGDPAAAMQDLQRLASEPLPLLSSRRSRHFLAQIAPRLLQEIGHTPDPPTALKTLADVSDSLGGKSVLWELCGATPAAMQLFVRLCACSPYLTGILVRHPGMIDEVIDSLLLNRLPSEGFLEAASIELCRGAGDIGAVMHAFKNGSHLGIGARDCLGKDPLAETHAALAAVAESVIRRVSEAVQASLAEQFGDPVNEQGQPIELVILALGKLGAREPNYHSDHQLLFLYTAPGHTRRRVGGHRRTISASDFFRRVAAQTLALLGGQDGHPRLFDVADPWPLSEQPAQRCAAVSLAGLEQHFIRGQATLAQRLAICNGRAISGSPTHRRAVDTALKRWVVAEEFFPAVARQIGQWRQSLERSAAEDNLKRGPGGTVDVELLAQMLQLRHGRSHPEVLLPGTTTALQRIAEVGLIDRQLAETLVANYQRLRLVESKLRLMDTSARHEIPSDPSRLRLLALLMGRCDGQSIVEECRQARAANREIFNRLMRASSE